MRKLGPVFFALLLATVAVPIPNAGSTTRIPSGFKTTSGCTSVAQGVEYLPMRRGSPAANAYVGHIAAGSPVRLRVVSSNDRVTHDGESMEVPSSQCRRLSCLLGINGDYHDPGDHEPLGGIVKQGRLVRTPNPGRPHLYVWSDGRVGMGELPWTGSAKTREGTPRSFGLGGINTSLFPTNGLMLYTSDWGSTTKTSSTTEIIVKPGEALAPLGRTVTVNLQALGTSNSTIPAGGAVLSGKGTAATFLKDLWNRGVRQLDIRVDSAHNPFEALGGNPFLIGDGKNAFSANDSFATSRQPRTFVGFNDAGDVFIVAVDGRQSASGGFSLTEAADFLRGLGATEGLNFDGGGGTVFVKNGQVASSPVDDGNKNAERGAPDSLAIVVSPPAPGPALPAGPRSGYWMVSSDGSVYRFGDARQHGYPRMGANKAVDLEPTPSGNGYWVVDDGGHVFAMGDAPSLGNADPAKLVAGEMVVSLSATPSGNGYWIFTSKGRALVFGDAVFRGDKSAQVLNGPVLDSVTTPSGNGYYMVASDGGVFTFGDAKFAGSTGDKRLNAPVQSLVADPDGVGYWLVASDGGVFAFQAPFRGSMGATRLNKPMSGMVAFGNGYLMVAEDGGIFNFSDKPFHGSLGACAAASPVISVAALD
jgi:phosphodiester glycosidase